MNGASNFEEIIQDIDEAIQYVIRSSNSKEANPYISLVQEGSKALGMVAAAWNGESELDSQELEALGTLRLGTLCTTSHVEMYSNLDWGLNGVAEGGS